LINVLFQGALIGLIVSVAVQLWIFMGSQIYRKQMRSFVLPTRIDGCIEMRGNISLPFNTTIYSTAANVIQTAVK
jgi:hypothetical protein